jgi:hypothetical protein
MVSAGRARARVGLLVGRERSFPEALAAEVARRDSSVQVELAKLEAPRADVRPLYDVLVDRISHEVPSYQPWLKLAALYGTRVVNDPFWRTVDDKFLDAALAGALGVAVPRTVLLPNKSHGDDVTAESLRNLSWVDWDALVAELGLPMYLKPHWGGGWRDVFRVTTREELLAAYDRSGRLTLIAQSEVTWTQYVRCLVIGQNQVRPALWDPRLPHTERYLKAPDSMPPLEDDLRERVEHEARLLCEALGYDMNTVEFAIHDGVPYAIDFMNSAPDLDEASLGPAHFRWVVERMGELVLALAHDPDSAPLRRWDALLGRPALR